MKNITDITDRIIAERMAKSQARHEREERFDKTVIGVLIALCGVMSFLVTRSIIHTIN